MGGWTSKGNCLRSQDSWVGKNVEGSKGVVLLWRPLKEPLGWVIRLLGILMSTLATSANQTGIPSESSGSSGCAGSCSPQSSAAAETRRTATKTVGRPKGEDPFGRKGPSILHWAEGSSGFGNLEMQISTAKSQESWGGGWFPLLGNLRLTWIIRRCERLNIGRARQFPQPCFFLLAVGLPILPVTIEFHITFWAQFSK